MPTFLDRLSMQKPDFEDDPGASVTNGRPHRPSRIKDVPLPVFRSSVPPGTPKRELVHRDGSMNPYEKDKRLSFLWG